MRKSIHLQNVKELLKSSRLYLGVLSLAVLLLFCSAGFVNDLRSSGYSLIPAPQNVEISGQDILVDNSWAVESRVGKENISLKRLHSGVKELFKIGFTGESTNKIILEIKPGIIKDKIPVELAKQGYRLEIHPGLIKITGNAEAGLFYGVQSFLQLLRPDGNGGFQLPEGAITDWPDLELRFNHWDTKHHQDRLGTMKRYLDQAAFFKVNAIGFEIEDKYEFPSHPVIGAPGAYTKAEMHELTAYALERYIQLVPIVQAPSHMTYVLKHEEFAHLKADGSNYHMCMCDEEAMQLIFDIYQDMIDATPGVDYFFASTDEVYYAGICEKCKDDYNEKNRSQLWVNYVNRVNEWMALRGRRVLAWVEFPLLTEHIPQLPAGLIDAIVGTSRSKEWIENENNAGIRQLAYSSMQGSELLFPNYFPTIYRNKKITGRLQGAANNVLDVQDMGANLIGTFAAAWDDSGLHNETFWLGWATVTQYAWTSQKPTLEQNTADFMDVFYGAESSYMVDIYKSLEEGARFYEALWERRISVERESGYGNSFGKGIDTDRYDLLMDMPPLPSIKDLTRQSDFGNKYSRQIEEAEKLTSENSRLIDQLMYGITRVKRNSYNLEILLTIAYLERFAINTIQNLEKIEIHLSNASETAEDHSAKVKEMVEAYKLSRQILKERKNTWSKLTTTWEKNRFEKCRSVDGKNFVHTFDDVKDHFADRRLGLEYMIAPFERMEIQKWNSQLGHIIEEYAKANNVPISGVEIERLED
jgi:hexosaminidase